MDGGQDLVRLYRLQIQHPASLQTMKDRACTHPWLSVGIGSKAKSSDVNLRRHDGRQAKQALIVTFEKHPAFSARDKKLVADAKKISDQ